MIPSSWDTEQEERTVGPEYKVKAHLVLEGSEKHEWGVVKDCHGCINYIPEDAEIVGTWSKYSEGTYWVNLETPIQALQDKATLLTAELARRRAQEPVVRRATAKRTRRAAPEPVEDTGPSAFDELRAKLRND